MRAQPTDIGNRILRAIAFRFDAEAPLIGGKALGFSAPVDEFRRGALRCIADGEDLPDAGDDR
jgi:hypothetical protein